MSNSAFSFFPAAGVFFADALEHRGMSGAVACFGEKSSGSLASQVSDRSREPHIAGHATHFLRRLDRACDRQVELALVLYRDAELLREVLRRASVPDGASRVAIALEPGELGPYVVVTRDGAFVTCLAEGMRTTGLYVVGFEAL